MREDSSLRASRSVADPGKQECVRCTCRSGRDFDGSEFGPCAYCERVADEEMARKAIIRDAARWRISQVRYPRLMDSPRGFFSTYWDRHGIHSAGIQPHPITSATNINACIMGEGKTKGEAIDGMFASLSAYVAEGKSLPDEIEAIRALFDHEQDAGVSGPPANEVSHPSLASAASGMLGALMAAVDPACIGVVGHEQVYFRDNDSSRAAIAKIKAAIASARALGIKES